MSGIERVRAQKLGAQVWYARERAQLGEAELAQRIGVSSAEISSLENGTHPQVDELVPRALNALAQQRPAASRIIINFTQHLN